MAEVLQSLADLGGVAKTAQPDAPVHVKKVDAQGRAYATGKRKNAIARVWGNQRKGIKRIGDALCEQAERQSLHQNIEDRRQQDGINHWKAQHEKAEKRDNN